MMAIPVVLAIVLVGFGVGWVRLFDIKLGSERVMLFGILLVVSGIGFLQLWTATDRNFGISDLIGATLLLTGLATGVLGFFFGARKDES